MNIGLIGIDIGDLIFMQSFERKISKLSMCDIRKDNLKKINIKVKKL